MRRPDGDVWPPFYEQPWARSGRGTAWDGLSRYDLEAFNPWYFDRLDEFAGLCDRKGLVLIHQAYFQHNILEAGAHWADFPWRPANCLQATGFPEPPPYAGGKRVFMAESFYDVTHPVRRDLHRRYIRHCLDVLGGCPNVVFQTGEEFTGPRHFAEFWLNTIAEWQADTGKKVLVSLSATKDVQDAILADPKEKAVERFNAAGRLAFLNRSKKEGYPVDLTCLKLGSVSLVHMPGELFVEYQLAAGALRPDDTVCMAGYGDYAPFYIGTEVAYGQGGYETQPRSSNVAPTVEKVLMDGVKWLLGTK